MIYTIPNYYKSFHCLADKCKDTCCVGWQIGIDDKSLARYKNLKGAFGLKVRRSIIWRKAVFRQSGNRRCDLLSHDNLCEIQRVLGGKGLCRACAMYPRHVEEFENVREITLSMSCPEAARILLSQKEPAAFFSYEREGRETYGDFDGHLYTKLAEAREAIREILQDRSMALRLRVGLVLGLAHDMQVRVNKGTLSSCDKMLAGYRKESARRFVERKLEEGKINRTGEYVSAKRMFGNLFRLELIYEEWDSHLRETDYLVFRQGHWRYEKLHLEFEKWLQTHMPEWQIQCEQLLIYFIYTYFCGAVYDGQVYAKMQMAVTGVRLIYEMLAARWLKNDGMLDLEDVTLIVYRYCREVEHSDKNLEMLERMAGAMPVI